MGKHNCEGILNSSEWFDLFSKTNWVHKVQILWESQKIWKNLSIKKKYLVSSKHRWRFQQIFAVFSGYLNFFPKPLLCVCWSIHETKFSQPKRGTFLCATNNPFETQIYTSSWVKLLKKQSYQLSWVILHTLWSVSSFIRKGKVPHDFIHYCHTKVAASLLLYHGTVEI